MQDIFHWRVYLDMGEEEPAAVDEYDVNFPSGRGFGMFNQDDIVGIELIPQREDLRHYAIQIPQQHGAKPVFFRKRTIQFDPVTQEMLGQSTIHCIGWELPEAQSVASYCFVFEDGSALLTNNQYAV